MLKRIDLLLIGSVLGLCCFSLFFIYSSSVDIEGNIISNEFRKQLIFLIVGIIISVVIQLFSLKFIQDYSLVGYIICIILLILTILFGEIRNGAKSWLGIWGFGIQASEFMKIATIMLFARILSTQKPNLDMISNFILYAGIAFIPIVLILLQPDMGTSLVYIPIILGIYYGYGASPYRIIFIIGIGIVTLATLMFSYYMNTIDGINEDTLLLLHSPMYLYYLLLLVLLAIISFIGIYTGFFVRVFKVSLYFISLCMVGGGLAYIATLILKPYQMQRLLVLLNPSSDPLGSGWHILQSVAAIGSGGLLGQGYLQGTQTKLEFLPQKSTDFIFSVISEEMGLVGSIIVLVLYLVVLWRIIIIGINSKDLFSFLYCIGVVTMLFTHFFVNIGMTLGIMPITGIPLLFVSYGGSALLSAIIAIAIVHNIYFHNSYQRNISKIVSFR